MNGQDPRPGAHAWAEIDLDAIAANVERLVEAAGGAEVMAVVKADAYGHGLLPVARAAREAGAAWLGTALLAEAVQLRNAGDTGPLLAWLYAPGEDFAPAVARGIDLGVGARWMLEDIARAARWAGVPARVHLKVDTGLARNGVRRSEWPDLCRESLAATSSGEIEIVGIWSHLAYADEPGHPTIQRQIATFDEACAVAADLGVRPSLRHLANSAATFTLPDARFDLVRPGISIYGISPGPAVGSAAELGLRPAMTLAARVAAVKGVAAGQGVSYGHEYVTDGPTSLALIPVGYADGIQRHSSGAGPVLLGGTRRQISGRVCMDQFVVDVGDDNVKAGDVALLFGPGDAGEPSADEWAAACGTIAYEIVACIGPRIPRVHLRSGRK